MAAGIENHKLLLDNDESPKTFNQNREIIPIGTVIEKDVTMILTQENRHTTIQNALRHKGNT